LILIQLICLKVLSNIALFDKL